MGLIKSLFGRSWEAEYRSTLAELVAVRLAFNALLKQWNELVEKLNAKGGDDFINRGVLPEEATILLSSEDITRLLQLCHPDKHGGKPMAHEMTAKLLSMRSK